MLEQTNPLPALICLALTLTPPRLLQINGCGSVAAQNNGRVGGAGKRMCVVDGETGNQFGVA